MANAMYTLGREHFLKGDISWNSNNIKANLLAGASYTPNLATDEHLSDIPGGAIVATSANLASKTTTGGTANAANITFTAVSGAQITYVGVYQDTGTPSTSDLIILIDTATNLPLTPNGGDITVQWDTGANKIFTLCEGLSERDKIGLWDLLKQWAGWKGKAELSPGGIWIPAPSLVMS